MAPTVVWKDKSDPATYEKARVGRVFNHRRPDRYPPAVVEASQESDVVDAVKLAREQHCRVSVRSGGHSWAVWSVRSNAVLVDLGNLKQIELASDTGIASVSPSTTGSMLNDFLSPRGLMFAGGHCPDVGLGGFLLQGGMGWNCAHWGWACEQIVAVDVVTAAGDLIRCDATQNSDLLWAAKGAGPGFPAVVVRFHLQTRKARTCMLSSAYIYPKARYREVMDWLVKITPAYDEDTEIVALSARPPGMNDHCIIPLLLTFKNNEADAQAALQSANESRPEGPLHEKVNQPTSLAQEYVVQGAANPKEHRYMAENAYISNDADVVAVLEEAFTTPPSPHSYSLWYAMAPCSRRELPDMALSMQSDHYFAHYAIWKDAADDDRCQGWVRNVMSKVQKHAIGAYLGDSDFQVRKTKFWTDEKAKRLMDVRRKWDPEGVICGYLDRDDLSGIDGLTNEDEWCNGYP